MGLLQPLALTVSDALKEAFEYEIAPEDIALTPTRKEFEGDYTVVLFPFLPILKAKPESIGQKLGETLLANHAIVDNFNVIKGFLNIGLSNEYWMNVLSEISDAAAFGYKAKSGKPFLVEFSSPNTNKPLHLGHIRNNLIGWSCSKILEAVGYDVKKVQVINDRGIAICKSMLAWQKFGEGATPESTGIKSDHLVGDYYVRFETEFQREFKAWQNSSEATQILRSKEIKEGAEEAFFKKFKNEYFNSFSALGKEAREMLKKWEDDDAEVRSLWNQMNNWVYQGFETTYKNLGVAFDQLYYESETYLLGKEQIEKGLESGVFYRKDDGSVWIDLTDIKLDHKLVLRSDGTSVYMTQDIGTADLRYQEFGTDRMIYVVGDEQNYHFKVLFEILKRLEVPYADGLFHLSYGMVDLPTGKMKGREGTIVDADDLMAEVINEAKGPAQERGIIAELSEERQNEIFRKIGMAALKFFIIKVNPKKRIVFDPKESVDMQGQTGPYVQNAFVRIQSILRRALSQSEAVGARDIEHIADQKPAKSSWNLYSISEIEKGLLLKLASYPEEIEDAARDYDPSVIANYCYSIAKDFHRFYHDMSIMRAESEQAKQFRIVLSMQVAKVLESAMDLLGIEMPEKM